MQIYSNYKNRPDYVETDMDDEILAEQIGYRTPDTIAKEMIDAGMNLKAQRMGITREMLDADDDLIYTPVYEIDPTELTDRINSYYESLGAKVAKFQQQKTQETTTQKAETETTINGSKTEAVETETKG